MNRTEAELIYKEIKSTDEIAKEFESLRPSDNPVATIIGYILTIAVFIWILTVTDFGNASENIAMLLLGFILFNQILVSEINRRTHRRIDALYKLMMRRSAEQDA